MKPAARLPELDLLRFIAAVAVMLLHYGIRGFAADDHSSPLHFPDFGPLVRYNYLAVNLFFMISGFVILMSSSGKPLRQFAISRVVRLYPAYWVCCILTFLTLTFVIPELRPISWPRFLANLTMLNGFVGIGPVDGVYWTLKIELTFYVWIGVMIALGVLPRVELVLGAWLALAALHLGHPMAWVDVALIPASIAWFVAGAMFYLIHRDGVDVYKAVLIVAALLIGWLYELGTLVEKAAHYGLPFDAVTLAVIVLLFGALFVLLIVPRPTLEGRAARLCAWLGALSYPIYLLHNYLGLALFNRLGAAVDHHVLLVGVMLFIVLLAHLLCLYIERPLARVLKRWLDGHLPGRPTRSAAMPAGGAT